MIIFGTLFKLANNLIDIVVRTISILGACAFVVILIVEGYLRLKEITQEYRRRIIHPPATNPCTDRPHASCSCSCHLSPNDTTTNTTTNTTTPNEEKQQ